jgi:hypothetical protein
LVDANVLSEATRPHPEERVVSWLMANDADIVVDPFVLGELRLGILLVPKGRRRTRLEGWFEQGVERLHCVQWDAECGLRWAQLVASLRASGTAMPIKDSLIATTALVYNLVVVTRNVRDFEKARVGTLDPFAR